MPRGNGLKTAVINVDLLAIQKQTAAAYIDIERDGMEVDFGIHLVDFKDLHGLFSKEGLLKMFQDGQVSIMLPDLMEMLDESQGHYYRKGVGYVPGPKFNIILQIWDGNIVYLTVPGTSISW